MSPPLPPEPVDILIVDDRDDNLVALKALLRRDDYNLVVARSGPEALAQVLRRDFAVILLDVAMPGMDGFETASIIRERKQSRKIPIVFVTASAFEMQHVFRGYMVGAVDYLTKPIDPHALRAKVAVFVELFRQRREIERQAERIREVELREQRMLRQRAEQALRATESLYQLLFEQAPVGIGHMAADGRFTRVNDRLAQILGGSGQELVGRRIVELAGADDREGLEARVRALAASGGTYLGEHRLTSLRDEPVWVELTLSALHDHEGGQVRQLVLVVNDVSARKQAELERSTLMRELEEGVRARDTFLSIAAHELRTPMTPLNLQTAGLLQELEGKPGGAGSEDDAATLRERLRRRLRAVNRSTLRLKELTDRLLDVTQLAAGGLVLEREDMDLVELVEEIVARLKEQADRSGSPLSLKAEGALLGQWDKLRLDQAITNIVGNALKYGAGAPIEIELSEVEGVARVSVRDHGIGIAPEAQERIFERFERVAPVSHYGGFGLGLWIVRQIVEAHGGHVVVESSPGRGSEFTVLLPLWPDVFVDTARSMAGPGSREARP